MIKKICYFTVVFLTTWVFDSFGQTGHNLIVNNDFSNGKVGSIPEGWVPEAKRPTLMPSFKKVFYGKKSALEVTGSGRKDVNGSIKTEVSVEGGKTYLFKVRFRVSDELNPHRHLLFQCYGPRNKDGIFEFEKKEKGWVEGAARIHFPGTGPAKAVVRIIFRHSEDGKATITDLSLTETEPLPQRWVRVAVTSGKPLLTAVPEIVEKAAGEKADIILLPEFMNGGKMIVETLDGPSCSTMSKLARKYNMYVAGGIVRQSASSDQVFNTTVLYDRLGNFAGMYDKIHPYSPEVNEEGITPGDKIVVLDTDFGKVGFMTCYDSWFTDVAELTALRGAELVLFPNAGYYRSIIPARAADNNIRIMASSLHNENGIWDTGGRDVVNPDADKTSRMQKGVTFRDPKELTVGNMKMLVCSLDLNYSPSPHYNDGTMYSAPGGRRNRSEQLYYLEEDIKKEKEKWWIEK